MRRHEYTLDLLPPKLNRLILRLKSLAIALPALYALSYFYFGKHESGVDFENGREFTCHYRDFSFDPWIYKPSAWFECWLRGKRIRVQLFDESNPEGRAYGYGPYFEQKRAFLFEHERSDLNRPTQAVDLLVGKE